MDKLNILDAVEECVYEHCKALEDTEIHYYDIHDETCKYKLELNLMGFDFIAYVDIEATYTQDGDRLYIKDIFDLEMTDLTIKTTDKMLNQAYLY